MDLENDDDHTYDLVLFVIPASVQREKYYGHLEYYRCRSSFKLLTGSIVGYVIVGREIGSAVLSLAVIALKWSISYFVQGIPFKELHYR